MSLAALQERLELLLPTKFQKLTTLLSLFLVPPTLPTKPPPLLLLQLASLMELKVLLCSAKVVTVQFSKTIKPQTQTL